MEEPLEAVVSNTRIIQRGAPKQVFLACDALTPSFKATICTHNLMAFDPA